MGRGKKQAEADEAPGAPEWMVTFSDCMTLLLTFFVLLLSFSSFDNRIFRKLKVIFSDNMDSVNTAKRENKDAFLPTEQIEPTIELERGSEKPTLVQGVNDGLKEETEPVNFRRRKVFLIPSEKIFWGKGRVISSDGRKIMTIMASFLKEVPSRVVISENGPPDDKSGEHFGLPRAWAVMNYLTTNQNLDEKQFSISAVSTLDARYSMLDTRRESRIENQESRILEIVLLERSIYN